MASDGRTTADKLGLCRTATYQRIQPKAARTPGSSVLLQPGKSRVSLLRRGSKLGAVALFTQNPAFLRKLVSEGPDLIATTLGEPFPGPAILNGALLISVKPGFKPIRNFMAMKRISSVLSRYGKRFFTNKEVVTRSVITTAFGLPKTMDCHRMRYRKLPDWMKPAG